MGELLMMAITPPAVGLVTYAVLRLSSKRSDARDERREPDAKFDARRALPYQRTQKP
jgi:hypothetical protein